MNLQDLGNLSQFIGGIAIVISLIYLARQVRQNTRVHGGAAYQQAAAPVLAAEAAILQNADLAGIMVAGMRGDTLPAEEQLRFEFGCTMMFYSFEHLFRQYERQVVDPDAWNNAVVNFIAWLCTPPVVALWRRRTGPLSRRLLSHLESRQVVPAMPDATA